MATSDKSLSKKSASDIFWNKAAEATRVGDHKSAVNWFRKCVEETPDYPLAALNLGILLTYEKKFTEAISYLEKAVKLKSDLNSVTALANALLRSGNSDGATRYLESVNKSVPGHVPTLIQLGEIKEQGGDRKRASEFYRQAKKADEKDLSAAIKYAIASWDDDPAETAAVLDQHLKRSALDSNERIKILISLIIYKEFNERIKRGLMPYHATSLDELFFTYTAAEFAELKKLCLESAENNPTDPGLQIKKFLALFCSNDRIGAQSCINEFKDAVVGQIWDAVNFDPSFYKMIGQFTDADIIKGLPPVQEIITCTFSDEPVAYLSCNYLYFENFAAPMLRSLSDKAPGSHVHVHIMDVTPVQLAAATKFCKKLTLINIALSVEQPGVDKEGIAHARSYYHAIRFIRFYQHLLHYKCTLWLMDVDALFNRDPHIMYEVLGHKDAAMRIRAGRLEPWNQFNACIVAGTSNAQSLEYFRLISAYIAYYYQKSGLRWGIDQLAMYGVFEYMRDVGSAPELAFLDDKAIDYDYMEDGIIWCNSGRNKFLHLQRNPDGSIAIEDPDRAAYIKLFDKYFQPLSG